MKNTKPLHPTLAYLSWKYVGVLMLACLLSVGAYAQKTITGKITNQDTGEGMVGVTVQVKGTTTGSLSDGEGNYSVSVPGDNAVLVFSFLGFGRQEITVGTRSSINVSLIEEGLATDEVVITALGISREKKALTYAAQNVNADELSKARDLNVVNSLSGKVAGISISRSGSGVGSPSRVILRGNRSIAGNNQPLYIVDGVPILGDVTDVNPDDIESITVLKGPNAAALYGARANNGAIIITTKSGTRGFNVSLSTTYMAEVPIFLREYQNEYGQGNTGQYSPASEQSWGPSLNGGSVAHWSPDPNFGTANYPFSAQPDNVKDFYQTGHNWATNLSISSGNENNQTYFSYTFTDAAGVVPTNELERHNVHLRVTNKLAERLTLDAKMNYIREDLNNVIAQGENFANPNRHAYRLPRNIRTQDIEMFEYTTPEGLVRQHFWNPGSNGGANPYWAINRNLDKNTVDRIIAYASLKYQITDGLSLMVRSAVDRLNATSESKDYADSYIIADNGRYSLGRSENLEWNNDILLSYENQISDDLYFNVNAGANSRMNRNSSLNSNTGTALTLRNFFALSNTQNVVSNHDVGSPVDVNSVYGFGQLTYLGALTLDVTARNDWSSTLPAANRSFFYSSYGVSAVLSDLLTLPTAITFAKVRASYAIVGNDTQPYQLQRTAGFAAGGNNGFLTLSGTLPNENLLPEETTSIEVGADLRFLDNRIGLDFTWYKSNSRDQLFSIALPIGSGATTLFTNGGDVQNTGVEAVLSLNPVRTSDFDWDVYFNFTKNNSLVVEINDERPRIQVGSDFLRAYFIEEGEPFGNVYSRGFERDAQGRVIVGADGLPRITGGRTVLVGNYNPDWMGGIRNTIRWKKLNASFLIDIRQGGSTASITDAIIFGDGHVVETLEGRDGSLVFGQNFYAEEEAVLEDGTPNNLTMDAESFWRLVGGRNAPAGEVFRKDASNMRLRELVLGYTIDIPNAPVNSINVSLVGRNLFFFYNKAETLDPELIVGTGKAAEGFESFAPPTARSIGASIQLQF